MREIILVLVNYLLIRRLIGISLCSTLIYINCYAQWQQIYNLNHPVTCFAVSGNNIYAGTYYEGIYLSTNNGINWTNIAFNSLIVWSITTNANVILAGIDNYYPMGGAGGVYLSTNYGTTWIRTLNNQTVYSIIINGDYIFAGTEQHGIYRSVNNGLNWLQTALNNQQVRSFAVSGNNIFAGTYYNGVFLSTNNGDTWVQTALNNQDVLSLVIKGNNIFAGTEFNGIYLSTNNGTSWTRAGIFYGQGTRSLVISGNNIFASAESYQSGVYLSQNNGSIWIQKNQGFLFSQSVLSLLIKSDYIFAGAYDQLGNRCIWRRSLSEITKTDSVSGNVKYSDNNLPVTNGSVKAFTLDKKAGNIFILDSTQISSNGTYTLSNVPQDSVYISVFPGSSPPPDYVITYYPSTIFWQNASVLYPTGNLSNINISAIRMINTTAANSVNGKVSRLFYPYSNIKDAVLFAKNGNTFVGCTMTDINGLYHLLSLPSGNLKIIVNRIGFLSDSTNVNVTPTSNIDSINFHLYSLFTGIKQTESEISTELKLSQNYPNPFNPVTRIKFEVAMDSRLRGNDRVVLKVYDILGKEIQTLVNEQLQPGTYEVTFDGSNLPSGVYFYKLRAGDYTETKKMLMIK